MPTNLTGLSAAQRAWRLLPSVFAMASYVRCRTPSRVANVTATYARSDAGDMTASLVTSTRARYPFRSRFARRIVRHPGSSHPSRSSSRRQYRSDRSQHPRDAAHSETDSARAFRGRCKPLRRAKSFKPPADSFRNASIGIHAYREPRRVAGVSTMIPPRRPSADARFALTFRERLDSTCFGLYVFRPWGVVLGWNWLPVANSEGARGSSPSFRGARCESSRIASGSFAFASVVCPGWRPRSTPRAAIFLLTPADPPPIFSLSRTHHDNLRYR